MDPSSSDFLSSILGNGTFVIGSPGQFLLAFGVAYLGGVLASLTPCVYPMIPITVSVVGGIPVHGGGSTSAKRSLHEILLRAFVYILGMTLIYSFLGVAAGLTGRVFGTLTNNSRWYLILGTVMTAAALIMLDVIPFDPLSWWERMKRKLGRDKNVAHVDHQREMTLLGAFTLGASSGLIAAPCTTPVMTAILAYIAKTQSIGVGLVLMIGFSLGLSTLLLLIATFTGMIQVLPRSGNWMKAIKLASGLILLGFAQYLIYQAGKMGGI